MKGEGGEGASAPHGLPPPVPVLVSRGFSNGVVPFAAPGVPAPPSKLLQVSLTHQPWSAQLTLQPWPLSGPPARHLARDDADVQLSPRWQRGGAAPQAPRRFSSCMPGGRDPRVDLWHPSPFGAAHTHGAEPAPVPSVPQLPLYFGQLPGGAASRAWADPVPLFQQLSYPSSDTGGVEGREEPQADAADLAVGDDEEDACSQGEGPEAAAKPAVRIAQAARPKKKRYSHRPPYRCVGARARRLRVPVT